MMKSGSTELGIVERFAAGSLAGVFSQTAIYPLEVHCHLSVIFLHTGQMAVDSIPWLFLSCHGIWTRVF